MHSVFMQEALKLAKEAYQHGEIPVGCVIVKDEKIIARGRNRREEQHDVRAHAEMEAIGQACAVIGDWRLTGCTVYVTLEPCPMCAGALLNARPDCVVYGASDPTFGACGGVLNLFEEAFGTHPRLYGDICGNECTELLQAFFHGLRLHE